MDPNRLRAAMSSSGMGTGALARALGLPRWTVSDWLRPDPYKPSKRHFKALCKVLKCEERELL